MRAHERSATPADFQCKHVDSYEVKLGPKLEILAELPIGNSKMLRLSWLREIVLVQCM